MPLPPFPLPPTPREVFNEAVPRLPTAEEVIPKPEELVARKEEVLTRAKEFVVEMTPKPKDFATAAREMIGTTLADKVRTIATIATPPAIVGGAFVVAVGILIGMGVIGVGIGAGAGKGFEFPKLPELPKLPGAS